jgi:hypothetical protein
LVKAHSGISLNACADQPTTRGVPGDSYSEEIPVTPLPEDEPEKSEELKISEEEATPREDWEDLEHLPLFGLVVESLGLAGEEQREEQENMLNRFRPSPMSGASCQLWSSPSNQKSFWFRTNQNQLALECHRKIQTVKCSCRTGTRITW